MNSSLMNNSHSPLISPATLEKADLSPQFFFMSLPMYFYFTTDGYCQDFIDTGINSQSQFFVNLSISDIDTAYRD